MKVEIVENAVAVAEPVPAGRIVFRVTNAGARPHQLTLVRLAEDSPPIDELLRSADGHHNPPDVLARVADIAPGQTGMVAAELADGARYALVDLSQAPDGRLYARLGATAEFRAGAHADPVTLAALGV